MLRKPIAAELAFYSVAAVLCLSVLHSAALHYVWGPEPAIAGFYYTAPADKLIPLDLLRQTSIDVFDRSAIRQMLIANKRKPEYEYLTKPSSRNKLTRAFADAYKYMLQSEKSVDVGPPFQYRVLHIPVIQALRWLFPRSHTATLFLGMNVSLALLTSLLFVRYLHALLGFSRVWALLGAVLFASMTPLVDTMPFTLLEPASFLAALVLFWCAKSRNAWGFAVASIAAVLLKEVFLFASFLWLFTQANLRDRRLSSSVKLALVCAVPVVTFSIIRKVFGAPALEVNFGFDLARLELPAYAQRMTRWDSALTIIATVAVTFGGIWLGLIALRDDRFLLRSAMVIPLVIVATIVLSGSIGRVLGVLFPVLIPAFLLFARRQTEFAEGERRSPTLSSA